MSINYQEAHAVIMMCWNLRKFLTEKKILLFIDNTSVMYSIFKQWAGSEELMEYIQELSLIMSVLHRITRVFYSFGI